MALVGKAGAGKTTGAEFLEKQYGYTRLSFANPLKDVVVHLWGAGAVRNRTYLQDLGVAVREIDPDTWVNLLVERVKESAARPIVVDDCRFDNEYWKLKELGFVFIGVHAEPDQRIMRLKINGKLQDEEQLNHVSEMEMDNFDIDYTARNNVTINLFEGDLANILYRESKRT